LCVLLNDRGKGGVKFFFTNGGIGHCKTVLFLAACMGLFL